jgi:trehalose-6-phosphate synthase
MGVFPIGINSRKFDETLDTPEFAQRRDEFVQANAGKRVVLSVERMDYTKGILHRLDAIEQFLEPLTPPNATRSSSSSSACRRVKKSKNTKSCARKPKLASAASMAPTPR